MTVYSSKTQVVRSVNIEPTEEWGGQGLLGVSIRFCSFEGANENVWHVLEVHPSSPAEIAGLRSFTDYIIGADSVLHESEDLFALIEAHEARSLKLYVYNSADDCCREVTITPHRDWGGEGSLGCGIGYGYLHRIPIRGVPMPLKPTQQINHATFSKSDTSPTFQSLVTNTTTVAPVASPIINPQDMVPLPQYSVPAQSFATPPFSTMQPPIVSNLPPTTGAIFNNPLPVSTVLNETVQTNLSTVNLNNTYMQTTVPIQTTFPPTSINPTSLPLNVTPNVSTYFSAPITYQSTHVNVPASNYDSTQPTPLIFDPTIAAQSAQQLLSNSNTPVS
ncbi:hypothetical protein RI129_004460 [Pyrocoelia pectoralis]|uniref:PDZ GRASP-type domain-containing protein n=1 Tax=Pyrocoelia pectoralis TaxID=417401 RepID=A0AAN7ZQP2_9COLE